MRLGNEKKLLDPMIVIQDTRGDSAAKRQKLVDEPRTATGRSELSYAIAKSSMLASFYPSSPSHAFFRTLELMEYRGERIRELVVDLGCGEGRFARTLFDGTATGVWLVGVDLSLPDLMRAGRLSLYDSLILTDLRALPLRSETIPTFVSNSVLEHIPRFELAIKEIARCLQIGGRFYITFVTENILLGLIPLPRSTSRGLRSKIEALTVAIFNRVYFLQQRNFVEPRNFALTLNKSGFRLVRVRDLLSKRALLIWHWLHLVTLIVKAASILVGPLRAAAISRSMVLWGLSHAWRKSCPGTLSNIFVHAEKVT